MPAPPERLAALQKQFADHIRDPDAHPAPAGIEERRLVIYRRLFFNNLSNLFGKNFPRVRAIVDNERWKEMIRAFMDLHRSTTPLFPELGREFVRFLAEHPEQHTE
ncbi:MAG: putative DNA-binding domain-containing protein, partial [Pseudomonadota bacterium]